MGPNPHTIAGIYRGTVWKPSFLIKNDGESDSPPLTHEEKPWQLQSRPRLCRRGTQSVDRVTVHEEYAM